MIAGVATYVSGTVLLQAQAQLPALAWALALVPLGAMWITLRSMKGRAWVLARCVVRWLLAGGLGFFWAAGAAQLRMSDALPHAWEGEDLRLTGVIARLPQRIERGVRFEFDVEAVAPIQAQVPRRIALSWYGAWRWDAAPVVLPELHAGERWTLTVRLRRPHGTANPHGFDYEAWLLERGIRAIGYVRPREQHRKLTALVPRPGYVIERAREQMRDRILAVLDGRPYAGVIAALAVGDQRAIAQAQWTVFTRTGVNHLMSISGLHVTMVSGLIFGLVYLLWRRSVRLTSRLPARCAAALAGFLAALSYAAIAGFAIPAQRTVYMIGVVCLAVWMNRLQASASVLSIAVLVVTVLDPWAVFAPGFWLSFGAVAAIFYVGAGRLRPAHWAFAWAHTQWAVTLGLIPPLLVMFQQISLVSPLANAFAIPVISFLVVPLTLLGAVVPLDAILQLAHAVLALTMWVLERLAAVPAAVWQQHAPQAWTVAVALVGIVWLLLPRGFPARWIGLFALPPMFLALPPAPDHGAMRVTVLDVGQGMAVVVQTRQHALLYDAGPRFSADADSGARTVVPFVRATGIRRLDAVIVSHADNDHAGGLPAVLAGVPVGWLASSLPEGSPVLELAGTKIRCFAGQYWEWDGVRFEMLHPGLESYALERMRSNDRSCVLRIEASGRRMLLTGDAEARSEREMLARGGSQLRAEILLAPHHGSRTSSTPEFIQSVMPEISIFTVGYRNRFGHPRPDVVARYQAIGSRILRSDRHGAVMLEFGRGEVRLAVQRELRRRYWQEPPIRAEHNFDQF